MLGKKIKAYLDENGIKQKFLVEKTGLSTSTISDICTGTRQKVDALEYYKICQALGVPLDTFLFDEESEV